MTVFSFFYRFGSLTFPFCNEQNHSLMESFVPFGGFFSAPSDLKFPLGGPFQCPSRSIQCGDNCEQDASDVSKAGFASSVADQCQSSLPTWLQMAAPGANKALDVKVCVTSIKTYSILRGFSVEILVLANKNIRVWGC